MATVTEQRYILVQTLLSRGPLSESNFRSIFSQITKKESGSQQQKLFNECLKKINEKLSYVQFELRAFRNQYDGIIYYGVVNNVSDDQSKLGTKYTVPQIAFYKGVIEAIIQDAEASGSISNTEALNVKLDIQVSGSSSSQPHSGSSQIPTALKNFTMSQKEKTLDQLVKDQWLCKTTDGNIGLGLRSFLDLRSWFRANDVPACEVCNEAAVKGQHCPNPDCKVRLHLYCVEKKFSQQRIDRVCPSCSTQWHGAVEEDDRSNDPSQNPQPSTATGKKRRAYREPDADTPESDPGQTSLHESKRMTRRSSRLHN